MVIGGHAHGGYDLALKEILSEFTRMGNKADQLMLMLTSALHGSLESDEQVKNIDKQVNKLEYDITEQLHFILTRYTPSMAELRFLTALIKIAASLERVGDIAKLSVDYCRNTALFDGLDEEKAALNSLLEADRAMLTASLANLHDYDPEKMLVVIQQEKHVAEQSALLLSQFLGKIAKKPAAPEVTSHILLLARNVERLSDHAMDILRIGYYAHTGKRLKRKKVLQKEPLATA